MKALSDPISRKKVLGTLASTITTVKEMFAETKDNRYMEQIHEDTKKLCGKVAQTYRKLEQYVVDKGEKDTAVTMAMAMQLDSVYDSFNEINEWYSKMVSSGASF